MRAVQGVGKPRYAGVVDGGCGVVARKGAPGAAGRRYRQRVVRALSLVTDREEGAILLDRTAQVEAELRALVIGPRIVRVSRAQAPLKLIMRVDVVVLTEEKCRPVQLIGAALRLGR